jgi:hypothetical protein
MEFTGYEVLIMLRVAAKMLIFEYDEFDDYGKYTLLRTVMELQRAVICFT